MPDYKLRIIVEGIDKASAPLKSIGGALGNIGQIAAGVGIGNLFTGAVSGLADMARGALDSYAAYERLGLSLNSLAAKEALLTGQAATMGEAMAMTSGKSKELLDWVQKLAIESPFRQEDISSAFRLSMALGFNTAEAQRLTRAMVDFSTATGAGGETIERVSRALGQMKTKGKLSAEEMLQLSEAGVDANAILMRAFDMTGPQLFDAMKKGAIDVNAAIEAIVSEMEKLYGGAAKNSAASMSGLLSTLSEIGELSSRNLLAGVFQAAQPTIASIVGILSAPEFQAGLTAWGETLGGFAADGLESAAAAMERVDAALTPLLDKGAPPWLVALQGLMAFGDYTLDVKISPEVTTIKTPDGGLTVDVTANATTLTTKEGGVYSVDVAAQVVSLDSNPKDEWQPVKLVGKWEEGTIGSLIAAVRAESGSDANKVLLAAGWKDEPAAIAQPLVEGLRGYMETNPVNIGFDSGQATREAIDSFDWAAYQAKWQQVFDSWNSLFHPKVSPEVDWGDNFTKEYDVKGRIASFDWRNLWSKEYNAKGKLLSFDWGSLWSDPYSVAVALASFNWGDVWTATYLVSAAIGSFDWGDVWSKIYTVNATVKRTYEDVNPYPIYGPQMGYHPSDPNWDADMRAYYGLDGNAAGTDFWKGGWTWVGEKGPELLNLPRGARILSNQDSKQMIGQLAEGTTDIPGWLERGLTALGLWVPQQQKPQYGPPTREDALGWRNFQQKGTEAMQGAAKQAGDAFESAAQDTNDAFKSALQGVPGLFGTSQVTGDQMRLAEAGVPQNFADDYLRQLSDEVLNGVDWANVDVKDAAARAGIDSNLPADVILELFRNAWNDSSLFANPANLDLINQDAVKTAIEQQQKELVGKTNIMQLFGITDENMQGQADALGQGLASVFGQAAGTDAMKAAGVQAFAAIGEGFGDSNTAVAAVGGMAQAVITATGTPENAAALEDAGKAAAFSYYGGWKSYMAEAVPPPPTGSATSATGTPVGHNALGTANWRGGWTVVGEHGPELVDLPSGAAVYDANTTRRMRGKAARPVVVNQTFVVNGKLMAEQAAQRAVQLIRRGG